MEVIEDQDIDQNINFDVFDIWLVVVNQTPIEYFGQKIIFGKCNHISRG
jgi:hypothetical protein